MEKEEIDSYLSKLKGWKSVENHHITKEFIFVDFKEAINFINKVGEISEKIDHHPDIFLHDYKKVKIEIFTHSVDGLSFKDFLLAEEINKIMM